MRAEKLESELGQRIRALRVSRRLTQSQLAQRANVSLGALKHLEGGAGSTTTTMVKVLRALGEEGWISSLGPDPEPFNPLTLLSERQRPRAREARPRRVRHRRPSAPEGVAE